MDPHVPDEDDGEEQTCYQKLHDIGFKSGFYFILAELPLSFIDFDEQKGPTVIGIR